MQEDFRLGVWLVQPQLNQLVGPAGAVRVQPRSMAVLMLLAERPGELFSRQGLLDAAWGGAFVTEEVLTSSIWDLRRALGDDPQAPRFIQTVPRRGYRLIAPVAPAEPAEAADAALAGEAETAAPPPAPPPAGPPLLGAEDRNRRVLLDKVAAFWVDEVLARARAAMPALAVGRQLEWRAVADPWQGVVALDGLEPRPLPADKGILEVFDETGRALLVLGEPGAGKTVALLELAAAAVARARAAAVEPVPVVLHLAAWSARRGAFAGWVAEELGLRYQVPRAVARDWLRRDALLLLLDGLDEVAPAAQGTCAAAIDRFRDEHGMTAVAVACRSDEHAALPRPLRLGGALRLLPLEPAAIATALAEADLPGAGEALRRSLARDPMLSELVRTPLLLRLFVQSAGGAAEPAAEAPPVEEPRAETSGGRRLLAAFVERALGRGGAPWPRATTERRLSWLARGMLAHDQPLFHLERLQPAWLPRPWQAAYWLLSRTAVAAVIAGLAAPVTPADLAGRALYAGAGAAVGLLAAWRGARSGGAGGVGDTLLLGVAASLLFYALSLPRLGLPLAQRPAVYFGVVLGMLFGLKRDRHGPAGEVAATEALGWSWRKAGTGAGVGLLLGLAARGVVSLTTGAGGLHPLVLLPLGLFLATALGLLFGFEGRTVEAVLRPNGGIHRALGNAFLGGVLFGGVCGALETALIAGPAARLVPAAGLGRASPPQPFVPFALLGMGLFGFFWFGGFDAVKHYTLRLLLAAAGRAPLRLVPFLDFAASRDLLQKVGGGYLFLHRSLLDYFAGLTSPDSR